MGAQAASASVPSKVLDKFKTIDATFAAADAKWTSALSNLSQNATPAQLSKPSLVFVPALKTFDTGLLKCGFTGKAAADAATIAKLNKELVTDLSSIKSTKTFLSEFSALTGQYVTVQAAFAKDLGLPTADVTI
jgi:hypothetical protein